MPDDLVNLLRSYYGFSLEDAREVLSELRDTRSLEDLTRPRARVAATPPK